MNIPDMAGILENPNLIGGTFEKLAREYGINLVVLFGSLAKNRKRENSDMDIAILFSSPHLEITLELESSFADGLWQAMRPRCEIDLVVLNQAGTLLKRNVARTGIPLYEAAPGIWRGFRTRSFREFEDEEKFRKRRWKYTLRRIESESASR